MYRALSPELLAGFTAFHLNHLPTDKCWCGKPKGSVMCHKGAHHLYHSGQEWKAAMEKTLAFYGHNPDDPGAQKLMSRLFPAKKVKTFVWWSKHLDSKTNALEEIIRRAAPRVGKSAVA